MKKLLPILFISLLRNSFAGNVYVSATQGNDIMGDGTNANPLASITKALTVVASGDTIQIGVGTFTYSSVLSIPEEVSLNGVDSSLSELVFTQTTNACGLQLISLDGTNGNQTISNLTIDGSNLTARGGINVIGRSNVIIDHVTVQNFLTCGIIFDGSNLQGEPVVYATGNELRFSRIINCADRLAAGLGGAELNISGYKGMLVHDNIFNQTQRAINHNGNIIAENASEGGYQSGLKFYNNKLYKNIGDANTGFSFMMELWSSQGGREIYNNEFHGGVQQIDLAGTLGATKGDYPYSVWIHDNLFMFDTAVVSAMTLIPAGIDVEGKISDLRVNNNHFKNMPYGLIFSLNQTDVGAPTQDSIRVYNNLFENGGYTNGDYSFDIAIMSGSGATIKNVFIDNNTISTHSRAGFYMGLGANDTARNVRFRNNIVQGVVNYGWVVFDQPALRDSIYIQNNISYNNVNSNAISYRNSASTPTHFVNTGAINSNPQLNASFLPTSGSPAISSALSLGLPSGDIGYFGEIIVKPSIKIH